MVIVRFIMASNAVFKKKTEPGMEVMLIRRGKRERERWR